MCRAAPCLLALAALLGGCSQTPPPQTVEAEAPEPAADLEPMAAAAEEETEEADATEGSADAERKSESTEEGERSAAPTRDATVIAVAGTEPRPRTLWEASVAAREKRRQGSPARTSVTDENLHEFQGAELTFASPRAEADAPEEEEEGREAAAAEGRGEEYWRSRVLDLRLRFRAAVDELAALDERAAGLRRSFYAADDPYLRDAEIKPAWDRALDRAGELRRELVTLAGELEDVLEEGRRAGALPGWLRTGIELEPEPDELPRPREGSHEPGEPQVIETEPPPAKP